MLCSNPECYVPLSSPLDCHNGQPLFDGDVCITCNHLLVIQHRLSLLFKHLKEQKLKGEQLTLKLYEEEE